MILCRRPFQTKIYYILVLVLIRLPYLYIYVRKIAHYSVQPNDLVNTQLKNPDLRIKSIIWLKSLSRFLLKRIQKSNIQYPVDKKPQTFLNFSDSVIRNKCQLQNIPNWIWFLLIPIWFTPINPCPPIDKITIKMTRCSRRALY